MIVGFRWICSAALFVGMAAGQGDVSFNRDVRPILSDRCFGCHGPDAPRGRSGCDWTARRRRDQSSPRVMRRRASWSGASRPRIRAVRMPPAYSGLKLSDKEIQTLRSWVEQGAKWQRHWSFLPPVAGPLPSVSRTSWPRNPIDNFVLAKLENVGLQPSPEAEQDYADSASVPRPYGYSADSRRGGCLSPRLISKRVGEGCRPAPRIA